MKTITHIPPLGSGTKYALRIFNDALQVYDNELCDFVPPENTNTVPAAPGEHPRTLLLMDGMPTGGFVHIAIPKLGNHTGLAYVGVYTTSANSLPIRVEAFPIVNGVPVSDGQTELANRLENLIGQTPLAANPAAVPPTEPPTVSPTEPQAPSLELPKSE